MLVLNRNYNVRRRGRL